MMIKPGAGAPLSVVTAAIILLSGCGSSTAESTQDGDADNGPGSRETTQLKLEDGWVKAADSGMTAAFGTLRNDSEEDIVLTGVSTKAAEMGELHVTEENDSGEMAMREAADGFTVPAGGEHELEPGADHLMLMGLTEPLETGTTATVKVVADDGQEWSFEVPVREFSGADESYDSGQSTGDMEMDMESSEGEE